MSEFTATGGLITEEPTRLTGNTATTVFTASAGIVPIASIVVCPTSGTPNLTIEIYNSAAASVMFLRKTVAMTAGTAFIYNEVFQLSAAYSIRVTSSSATGDMDVLVTRGIDAAASRGRAHS